jgi:hypothetical protein
LLKKKLKIPKYSLAILLAIIYSISNAQEICDNAIDDDGDGLIDCFDSDCQTSNNGCVNFYFGADTPECRLVPDPLLFSMEEQYRTTNNVGHDYVTPAVGDLDGDGIPEIVTIGAGKLHVVNGQDGSSITSITYPRDYHNFSHGPTIADIDNDGTAEIFMSITTGSGPGNSQTFSKKQWIARFDYDGGTLTNTYNAPFGRWASGWGTVSDWDGQAWTTPQFVDFDEDGVTEMFVGNHVLNAQTGAIIASPTTVQRQTWPRGAQNNNDYMSAAFDILPDGFCPTCDGV